MHVKSYFEVWYALMLATLCHTRYSSDKHTRSDPNNDHKHKQCVEQYHNVFKVLRIRGCVYSEERTGSRIKRTLVTEAVFQV